MARCKRFVCL